LTAEDIRTLLDSRPPDYRIPEPDPEDLFDLPPPEHTEIELSFKDVYGTWKGDLKLDQRLKRYETVVPGAELENRLLRIENMLMELVAAHLEEKLAERYVLIGDLGLDNVEPETRQPGLV